MKLKPAILQCAAAACFGVGLIYALGIEGGAQVGGTISDSQFVTAMCLILLSLLFMRLGWAAEDKEKAPRKVHKEPEHTVKPSNKRKAG